MSVRIHGKEYITVVERMDMMRQSQKSFEIVESMPLQIGERCVWRVAILIDGCKFYGSAECHFNAKAGTADATDPFACAETSAIGRALGFAGYGAVDSIASADEVVRNQEPAPQPKQITNSLNAPTPFELQRLFKGINQSIETAQKLQFKRVDALDNLTPEACVELKQVYDKWKATFDERQKAS